jgi:hypothetical protein
MDDVLPTDQHDQKSQFANDLKAKILRRLTELRSYTKVNVEKEVKGRHCLRELEHMCDKTSHFCLFFVLLGMLCFTALHASAPVTKELTNAISLSLFL